MPNEARLKNTEKLKRALKNSILGPQNLGSRGPGPRWIRTWAAADSVAYICHWSSRTGDLQIPVVQGLLLLVIDEQTSVKLQSTVDYTKCVLVEDQR